MKPTSVVTGGARPALPLVVQFASPWTSATMMLPSAPGVPAVRPGVPAVGNAVRVRFSPNAARPVSGWVPRTRTARDAVRSNVQVESIETLSVPR